MKRILVLFFVISVFLSLVLSSCTVPSTEQDLAPQVQDESEAHSESILNVEGDDKQEIQNESEDEHEFYNVQEIEEDSECDNEKIIEEDQNQSDELKSAEVDDREYSDLGYPLNGPGTYEFNGFTFEGSYSSGKYPGGHEYHTFDIDHDFLYHGGGRSLYDVTFNFTLAFINADVEKTIEHLANNERYKKYIEDPTLYYGWEPIDLDYLESIKLSYAYTSVGSENITIIFTVVYFKNGWDYSSDFCMAMTLNDNNEWKVWYYDGC